MRNQLLIFIFYLPFYKWFHILGRCTWIIKIKKIKSVSSIWLSISESDWLNSWKKHHCKVKGHPDHHFDGNILLLMDSIVLYPRILNCFLFIGYFINITKISFDLRVSRHFLSMWKKGIYLSPKRPTNQSMKEQVEGLEGPWKEFFEYYFSPCRNFNLLTVLLLTPSGSLARVSFRLLRWHSWTPEIMGMTVLPQTMLPPVMSPFYWHNNCKYLWDTVW